jgi:hypothetical protein
MFGYRITFSMTAMIRHGSHELIRPLPRGVILVPTSSVERAGIVEATCGENRVRVVQRDLIERAERIELLDDLMTPSPTSDTWTSIE